MTNIIEKGLRRILRSPNGEFSDKYVQIKNQEANDYIRNVIHTASDGLMISKFGTIELATVCTLGQKTLGMGKWDFLRGRMGSDDTFDKQKQLGYLCRNAGFFPNDLEYGEKYVHLTLEDAKEIDILGSYLYNEKYLKNYIGNAIRVNLEGYYAPFLWKKPWTIELKGKRVLVIHPFVNTIEKQYQRRNKLFVDPEILPEFKELILLKAVQSMADSAPKTGFRSWFEALEFMKNEIDKTNFDIALIGCGAYGMSLAAHVKRKKKIAIHLAGWTQMLFGIYGKRWVQDQPEFSKYINQYWVRPSEDEKPEGAQKVEGGCYW